MELILIKSEQLTNLRLHSLVGILVYLNLLTQRYPLKERGHRAILTLTLLILSFLLLKRIARKMTKMMVGHLHL